VVSATSGTTDQLIQICNSKVSGGSDFETQTQALQEKHDAIAKELQCTPDQLQYLGVVYSELRNQISKLNAKSGAEFDFVLAVGERLSSILFSRAIENAGAQSTMIDARRVIKTNSNFGKAEPDQNQIKLTSQELGSFISESKTVFVTQGFIGSNSENQTTTLGRGGSDYSAALFAEGLGACEVQIWTDVPGILTMDPRVVPNAKVIPEMSFMEAAEMANFGAKVLHPATLWPAIRSNIPVFVGSTFHPEKNGTRILPDQAVGAQSIRALAVRKNQTLITVSSLRMLNTHGFLAKMFEVLARYQISVDLVTTSEVSVALTIDEGSMTSVASKRIKDHEEMLSELRAFADVQIEEDLSLIAVVGNALNRSSGVAAKVFHSISDFNMRLICHGASEHNICFLVSSSEANEVVKRLHHVCIEWSSK
jgi:aspartate kinase